jgi:methionyl-tRNA synthetase
MLLSAGEPLPSTLLVHGYLTRDGRKLSKSLGHTVDPFPLIERFGADAVRHWLLGQVPPFDDADYTDRRFEAIYNAALANDLGNLVQRTVSMLWRYRDGLVPPADGCPEPIGAILDALPERLHVALSVDHDPSAALRAIWRLVEAANQFVERQAPWALARRPEAAADLDGTLFALAEAVRLIGQALRPLLPGTADAIERQLGCPSPPEWAAALRWGGVAPGTRVATPTPLFPRADSASLGSA